MQIRTNLHEKAYWGLSALLLIGSLFWSVKYFHLTNEDAWIGYRYAENLAGGYGFVSHPGGPTEEAYSDLARMLSLSFLHKVSGWEIVYISKILGIISIYGVILFLFLSFRLFLKKGNISQDQKLPQIFLSLSLLSIGFSNYFVLWATQGLETTLYSFIISVIIFTLSYVILYERYCIIPILAIFSFVSWNTRPEGLMNFFICYGVLTIWAIYQKKWNKQLATYYFVGGFLFFIMAASLIIWKINYFGDFIANPTYVKLGLKKIFSPYSGFDYVLDYFKVKGLMFSVLFISTALVSVMVILINFYKKIDLNTAFVFFILLGFIASQLFSVIFVTGGDYMRPSRWLITHFPFIILLILTVIFYILHKYHFFIKYKHLNILVYALLVVVFIKSSIINEVISDQNWYEVGFISSYEAHKKLGIYDKFAHKLNNIMQANPGEYYALAEYGYVPYHVKGKGIDIVGVNTKQLARNFKYYDYPEVFYAFRDYTLSKIPVLISPGIGLLYKEGNVSFDKKEKWFVKHEWDAQKQMIVYQSDEGKVFISPAAGWDFEYFFQSPLFLSHYEIELPDKRAPDEWNCFEYKKSYNPTNGINQLNMEANRDKLMHGFIEEDSGLWVAPISRVLLRPEDKDCFLCLEGENRISSVFDGKGLAIEIRINGEAVGDKLLASKTVDEEGFFKWCVPLSRSQLKQDEQDLLITLKSTPDYKTIKTLQYGDKGVSFKFKALYFTDKIDSLYTHRLFEENEKTDKNIRSFVNFAENEYAYVKGIHEGDGLKFRWSKKESAFLLKHNQEDYLYLGLYFPDNFECYHSKNVNLSVKLNGQLLETFTVDKSGVFERRIKVPEGIIKTPTVTIGLNIDRQYTNTSDKRELGFIISQVGFQDK